MFRIKICGITTVDDARSAVQAGADAIGLNFFRGSPRRISIEMARDIIAALPPGVAKVGVFVNASATEVRATADALHLDYVQLHGDEPPDQLGSLADLAVLRAFRLGPDGLTAVSLYLRTCASLNAAPHSVLLDSLRTGQYGGTGSTFDWQRAIDYLQLPNVPPLVLAGGLTAENVADAIAAVRPAAVDTASGVESSPGRKDVARMMRFVAAARAAFDALEPVFVRP
ncbi:MAG TPA: phosphoribosylanthranilate isomerase [Pirellulales bacterium]|nr:phosphoribosylanthranilate isomerase [Pirellulales bacterium]